MLIMFRAKNFTSFHDDVVLDMRSSNYTQHPTHVAKQGDFDLLKTSAIYGANASGKSNLISALFFFEQYIFNQLFNDEANDESINEKESKSQMLSLEPFLLSEPVEKAIEFEMIFQHKDTLYQYGFSFEGSKIINEWLNINKNNVFERNNTTIITPGKKYKNELKNLTKYREDRLYLATLDYYAIGEIKEQIDLFKDFFKKNYNVYFELFFESSVKGTVGFVSRTSRLAKDEEFRKKIAKQIKRIDIGVEDLLIEKDILFSSTGEKKEIPLLKTVHFVYNKKGKKTGNKLFDLRQESSGTIRFLSFIQYILILLESGGVFIVDELSARLHPFLTKFVVDMFQSAENINNSQLIFTTHDTSLLNKNQFRRDEVLFVDKNEKGESKLYSLADIKSARQDSSFDKDYFNGKYGAIPIVKSLDNGGE